MLRTRIPANFCPIHWLRVSNTRTARRCYCGVVPVPACRQATRAADSTDVDLHGDIPGSRAIFGEADHHQPERLKRLSHVQAADIKRPKVEAFKEG